jgi:glucan phosphoethanolaminetransferase (alkaline phosphatase superfamily)
MDRYAIRVLTTCLVLSVPLMALGVWLLEARGPRSLAAFILSVAVMTLSVALLARTWRRFFLLQYPIVLLSAVFAIYTLSYDNTPGQFIAYVVATTSWDEIRGFFSIWQGMRWLLLVTVLSSLYFVLVMWPPNRRISLGRPGHLRWSALAVILGLGAYSISSPAAFVDGVKANPGVGSVLFAFGPLMDARATVRGREIRKVPFGAARVSTQEVHILVIGESSRRDSWSLYGNQRAGDPRDTTPHLEKLRGEAIFFPHAVADANFTVFVVPMLLTGMSPADFNLETIHGNIVDLAKEAGYSTAWLSTQDPHIPLLTGVQADHMLEKHLDLDASLLPDLQAQLASGAPRFIGLHTIGSHWQYDSRYPASFEPFGSASGLNYLSAATHRADPRIIDAYDNSIAYTDWFLDQVIEQARRLTVPATVTYFADHGEDLYSLDGNSGHGSPFYSAHQFDIPAFIWMNPAYRAAHPDKVQAIIANADKEIRSHNLFFSLADIMGIQWPGASPSYSFASSQFVPDLSSPLIAGGIAIRPP